MLGHVIAQARQASIDEIVVVVGYERDHVSAETRRNDARARIAEQSEQLGTGHAVIQARDHLNELAADQVVILSGDVPLLQANTIRKVLATLQESRAQGVVLSAIVDDPFGLGRIVRDKESGRITEIVEQKDCTPALAEIAEINSGVYAFQWPALRSVLDQIGCSNAQNEYYLTDAIRLLIEQGHSVVCKQLPKTEMHQIIGVNTVEQLEQVNQIYATLH